MSHFEMAGGSTLREEENFIIERAVERGLLSPEDLGDCRRTVQSLAELGVTKGLLEALTEHRLLTEEQIRGLTSSDQTMTIPPPPPPPDENTAERALRASLTGRKAPATPETPASAPDHTLDFEDEAFTATLDDSSLDSNPVEEPGRPSSGMTALDLQLLMDDLEDQEVEESEEVDEGTDKTALLADEEVREKPAPRGTPLSAFGDDLIDQVVGGCRIESRLGQGAMGTVYRAMHLALHKTVAVKILNSMQFCEKKQVEQFFTEARAAAAIDHQNIVAVHDVGNDRGLHFLVMQFIEGQSVAELLERKGSVPIQEATLIAMQAARGLAVAHQAGVVHRDIKPANIMLTKKGEVKIADFGLAFRTDENASLAGGVEVMGTPSYMSPEQIDGRKVDHRADLYSLGVTLYQLTTGRKPFEGGTPMEVLLKHVSEKPVPARQINPKIPEALGQVIERLMAKQPGNRYEDAESLANDLDEILQGGKPKVVVAMEDVIQRMEKLARSDTTPLRDRRPMIAAVVSGVAAALCAILFTFALPEIRATEALDGASWEDPLLREAEQFFSNAERFAGANPGEIEEIKKLLMDIQGNYPTPYPGKAATLLRQCERRYDELSRQEANPWLDRSARKRGEGNVVAALLALHDVPPMWLKGEVGKEVGDLTHRLTKDLREDTRMALVPGGTFLAGADKTEEYVAPFLIDITEVTTLDYAQFLADTGHPPPAHWEGGRMPSNLGDHPICGVTYADAKAYAAHVGKRLPTALEWEKAARGTEGRIYPWGDTFDPRMVNCQNSMGSVEPAWSFFQGRSPYECLNMAGNVHEWTSTECPETGLRIVMGGAYRSHPSNVRTFMRLSLTGKHQDPRLPVGMRLAKDAK
jgi:eukaryotic-like serine/threonine-protein kinase